VGQFGKIGDSQECLIYMSLYRYSCYKLKINHIMANLKSFLSILSTKYRGRTMTKNLAIAVKRDISDQMTIIQDMVDTVKELSREAEEKNDDALRAIAEKSAAQVRAMSEKVYNVGERVIAA
jgi:hypothetical protein